MSKESSLFYEPPSVQNSSRIFADIDRLLSEQRAKLSTLGHILPYENVALLKTTTFAESLSEVPPISTSLQNANELDTLLQTRGQIMVSPNEGGSLQSALDSFPGRLSLRGPLIVKRDRSAKDVLAKFRGSANEAFDIDEGSGAGDKARKLGRTSENAEKTKKRTTNIVTAPDPDVQKVIERVRLASSSALPDSLEYIDVTARTAGNDTALHVVKAKLRGKDSELQQAIDKVSQARQSADKKNKELQQLHKEHTDSKVRQTHQENRLKLAVKESTEARKEVEGLTKQLDRLSRELTLQKKQEEERKKKNVSSTSVSRLSVLHEKMTEDLENLKAVNIRLTEVSKKAHDDLVKERKRHHDHLKKFTTVMQKQNQLGNVLCRQREVLEYDRLLSFTESDFQSHLQKIGGVNGIFG